MARRFFGSLHFDCSKDAWQYARDAEPKVATGHGTEQCEKQMSGRRSYGRAELVYSGHEIIINPGLICNDLVNDRGPTKSIPCVHVLALLSEELECL